jgi:ribonuclease D
MNAPSQTTYIDSVPALRQFCAALRGAEWLAMDTEFLREKTYFPKFCLLQIASDTEAVACIDPLALESLDPLAEILFDPSVTKVFHAARQDLEIFFHLWNRLPAPIFDTQIAAPLIGMPEQISYAGLVSELLGVNLGKGHTRTDWSARPLSESQLRYAADDVIYLAAAYRKLRDKLASLGRLAWPDEDFAALLNPALYESAPEQAWQRISGAYQLRDKPLSVLQALAAWREGVTREQDIPRSWLLKDEAMLDLARLLPRSPDDIRRIRGVDERTLKRYGDTLYKLIREAQNRAPQPAEFRFRAPRKTPEQEALLDALSAVVRLRAAENSLNPVMLATRKDLEQLLDEPEQSKLLHGWRKAMAGEDLAAVLRGELQLAVTDGRLRIKHYV